MKLEEDLIEKVSAAAKVEPPKILVDRQIDRMVGDLENYLRYQGMGLDQFLELSGKDKDEVREERREEAEKRAKANLVLDAIAKKEGITADDNELKEKIEEIATTYNDDPERIRDLLEKQGRIPVMKEEIRIRKVIDLIVSEAKIRMVKAKAKKEETKDPDKKAKSSAKSKKPAAKKEIKSEPADAPAKESKE